MRTGVILFITAMAINIVAMSPAMAETSCLATADAAGAAWRSLSHASVLRPSQRIRTADGREFAGSQLNYTGVLIARAKSACQSGQIEQALGYIDEANQLLHPAGQISTTSAAHSN